MSVSRRAALVLLLACPAWSGQTREELREEERLKQQQQPKPDNLDDVPVDEQLYQDMMNTGSGAPGGTAPPTDPSVDAGLEKLANMKPGAKPPKAGAAAAPAAGSASSAAGSAPAVVSAAPSAGGTAPAKGQKAVLKAQKLGESLKATLRTSEDGMAGPPPDKTREQQPKPQASPKASSPADPGTPGDLAMAAMAGFKGSFERLELKVKDGSVVGKDGAPATPAQLDALRADIKAEPKALLTRPDLYDHIDRENFKALRNEVKDKPRLKAFRHLEVAEDRDLSRSASCEKVTGRCNPFAGAAAYKKGDFVPPEELARLFERPREKDEEEPEAGESAEAKSLEASGAPGPERVVLDAAARKPIYARLNKVFNAIKAMLGGSAEAPAEPSVSVGGGVPTAPESSSWGAANDSSGAKSPIRLTDKPKAVRPSSPPKPGSQPATGRAANAAPAVPASLLWLLLALGVFAVVVAFSRRSSDDDSEA
jgi:hypothetical protein